MEDMVKFLRDEIDRVKAERDAATASVRSLWQAVALLKGAAEALRAVTTAARVGAGNDEFLNSDTFTEVGESATADIDRAAELIGMKAAS